MSFAVRLLTLAAGLTLLCACNKAEDRFSYRGQYVAANLSYFKDNRTGICFAVTGFDRGVGIATVPCDKVPPNMLSEGQ